MHYEPVIGLEVHVQLKTLSKIFCSCSAQFGGAPNSQVCPVCLGMPGSLPVLNDQVLEYAARLALALNCRINPRSVFARKNFFYPDMPKAYQISQYEEPFCEDGYMEVTVDGRTKSIGITRIHLEEDAGKSLHAESFVGKNETLIDLNRSGVPLLEVVTQPDFRSPREAAEFLIRLRELVVFLGICDGNMEEGSLRCDANVSLRPLGEEKLGVKTELKNMNSFRAVERALEFEIHRQELVLDTGGRIRQQTLLWDTARNVAVPMRTKEQAHDYRYFPDPDLTPIVPSPAFIEEVKRRMPELPAAKRRRFVAEFSLREYDAEVLTESPALAAYFEKAAAAVSDKKALANWVMGPIMRALNEKGCAPDELVMTPDFLVELLTLLEEDKISSTTAKQVFDECLASGKSPRTLVEEHGLLQISDEGAVQQAVEEVLAAFSKDAEDYLAGNEKAFGFLMGKVIRAMGGKAAPALVNRLLRQALEARCGK